MASKCNSCFSFLLTEEAFTAERERERESITEKTECSSIILGSIYISYKIHALHINSVGNN